MKTCSKCGAALPEGSSCIPCLIATGLGLDEDRTRAERIFRIALSYDPDGRRPFFRQACGDDSALLEELELLLEGYEEEGGDEAEATLGGSARERWSTVRREEPGTVIDHFRLIRSIGEGGMGSVWEAEQSAPIKRRVALKIIKLGMDTEEVVRRFERERRTLALMTHPHIAQVFEAGATPGGRPYFAMELVEGEAITTHCARQGLDVRARLGLFLEVCAAVEYAHQKGVIHRDLKPSNILVADGGAKVIDFGVAKATQDDSGDGLFTRVSQVLGTPAYMSPEQAASNGADVDTRTDVYSLGVVLYELLSGVLPFDPKRLASTHLQEVQRILREETPPRPSTRPVPQPAKPPAPTKNPIPQASLPHPTSTGIHPAELKGDLDWIVMKALSKERDRRYASAADFARDVRRFLNSEAVSAVPPTMAYRFGKFVRRNKAVAGIMVALSAGLVVSLWQVQRTNRALAGEAEARQAATYSVADMYTRSGLTAADNNDPTRAALWFANAAIIGAQDPERRESNRLRAEAWRAEAITAVAAFDTGFPHLRLISWNPRFPAMLAKSEGGPESTQIWNLERETRWHRRRWPPGCHLVPHRGMGRGGRSRARPRDFGVSVRLRDPPQIHQRRKPCVEPGQPVDCRWRRTLGLAQRSHPPHPPGRGILLFQPRWPAPAHAGGWAGLDLRHCGTGKNPA